MTPQVISLSAAGSTAWIPVDYVQNPYNINIAIVVSNTPNLTCKVEYTLDDIFNPAITPTAFTHSTLTGLTSNTTGNITSPVRAIRLTVTAWTSGTATMTALQGVVNPVIYTDQGTVLGPVANQVAVVGTPFVIPAGDGAAVGLQFTNNLGAFTLSAAIITNLWNALKGCWIYLQANFGAQTYPAGWYWAVFTGDTAGTLYMNTYTSGTPIRPTSPTSFPVNLNGWYSTTTSEVTGPDGFVLPGGSMGLSGSLKTYWSLAGNAISTKSFFGIIGGTKVIQANTTTSPVAEMLTTMRNTGTAQEQINTRSPGTAPIGVAAAASATVSSAVFQFTTIDTNVDNTLSISLKLQATDACIVLLHANIICTYGE